MNGLHMYLSSFANRMSRDRDIRSQKATRQKKFTFFEFSCSGVMSASVISLSNHMWDTVIRFCVNVPVLSEQIVETLKKRC